MSVKAYLSKVKTSITSHRLSKPFMFVTGNQSADMDSVISAISYSYLSHMHNEENMYIPLINIPRKDLRLRRDIKNLLLSHSINEDMLYFIEDFESLTKDQERVKVILVDHCNVQGNLLTYLFSKGKVEIAAIIDHHQDEQVALDAVPRIIKPNGSCSALVFNYWYKEIEDKKQFQNNEVINLLLGPLLIDTSNMTQKVESGDLEAFKRYKTYWDGPTFHDADSADSRSDSFEKQMDRFFSKLKSDKKNVEGFSVSDILYKDNKQFLFGSDRVNVVFSSLGKSFYWIFKNYTVTEIQNGISSVLKATSADALVMTPSFTNKETGEYTREFGLAFYRDDAKAPLIEHLIPKIKSDLSLDDDIYKWSKIKSQLEQLKDSDLEFQIKNQRNIMASRKQIVPIVKDSFENHTD